MKTWKVIWATLVIFGAGVVTGGLLTNYAFHTRPHPAGSTSFAGNPHGLTGTADSGITPDNKLSTPLSIPLRRDFVDRLDRELKLTALQREHIEKIICAGQEQTRAVWQQIEPDMHRALKETKDKIRCELTREQQPQFEALFKTHVHEPPNPPAPREGATNAPVSMSTNSASLDQDTVLRLILGIKTGCGNSNAVDATRCLLQPGPKDPSPRHTGSDS